MVYRGVNMVLEKTEIVYLGILFLLPTLLILLRSHQVKKNYKKRVFNYVNQQWSAPNQHFFPNYAFKKQGNPGTTGLMFDENKHIFKFANVSLNHQSETALKNQILEVSYRTLLACQLIKQGACVKSQIRTSKKAKAAAGDLLLNNEQHLRSCQKTPSADYHYLRITVTNSKHPYIYLAVETSDEDDKKDLEYWYVVISQLIERADNEDNHSSSPQQIN